MNIRIVSGPLPDALEAEYERFGANFFHALDGGSRFRVVHPGGTDVFFSDMGEAERLFAYGDDGLVGSLTWVRRCFARGGRDVAYLCDLKIRPGHGFALHALAGACTVRCRAAGIDAAYGVVMAGAHRTPDRYSGRMGIAGFRRVADFAILGFAARRDSGDATVRCVSPEEAASCRRMWEPASSPAAYGKGTRCSGMIPVGLVADGGACGVLEDTRRGKRLIGENGREIMTAHLRDFDFFRPVAGARVLRAALGLAAERGFDRILVALTHEKVSGLLSQTGDLSHIGSGASVFATGDCPGIPGVVPTSEI